MTRTLKILLPFVVVAAGAGVAALMILSRAEVETRPPEVPPPLVRTLTVELGPVRLSVRTQGTVVPRTEMLLVPEVAGRVVEIAPSLVAGGFFETGQILLRLDDRDYELAAVNARAEVARAELRLAQEEREADIAREEWEDIGEGDPTALVLREPQVADARAAVQAARAALERAERDLERTRIQAPFDGRVREKSVDVGQYVAPGSPVARLYSVDVAEVRLPLPDGDLAYLDLPLTFRSSSEGRATGPEVILRARFAGEDREWRGRIVRTEGEIDPQSRMVHVVAQVRDPYGRGSASGGVPLSVGLFVEAEILGRDLADMILLPRSAVREDGRILVVDEENRLHFREIDVLKTDQDRIVVRGGLASGERVCLSALDSVVDGMSVRVAGEETAGEEAS
jgi:RND family efflux transporter MFP subunit